MAALQMLVERGGDGVRMVLSGELDMAEVGAFEDELRLLEQSGPAVLVLDLSGLVVIDSHGLSALLDAEARARGEGRRLVLVAPADPVMQVFRITLLDRRFEWIEPPEPATVDDALRAAVSSLPVRSVQPHV
jgi:anti-sigma B factor antagonist